MKLQTTYPKPSGLYLKRFERSYVIQTDSENELISRILTIYPNIQSKTELMINTYFEQILELQPSYSYIIRFRQRGPLVPYTKGIEMPKTWPLKGAGTLEVKIKDLNNSSDVQKTGTFLPDKTGQDIKELITLTRKPNRQKNVFEFIERANKNQVDITGTRNFHLLDPLQFSKIVKNLGLFAARINIRHSFELNTPEEIRITLETCPAFYAYPIEHKTHEYCIAKKNYKGYLSEYAEKSKIEIKTESEDINNKVYEHFEEIINRFKVPDNKYSKTPYYKMIVNISQKENVLINEAEGKEFEAKAAINKNTNIEKKLTELRNYLLKTQNAPYKLFATEPHIGVRDYAEKNRSMFGWKDNENNWHEAATLIRLTKRGRKEYGFAAVLKFKNDPKSKNNQILNRDVKLKYLISTPSEKNLLEELNTKSKHKVHLIGTCKKTKYRVYVQDKEGRTFCVSLDNTYLNKSEQMKQLEVEYVHTVIVNTGKPKSELKQSCEECVMYFINVLEMLGVKAHPTTTRKIDFLAEKT